MNTKSLRLLILAGILGVSCSKEDSSIPPEFQKYVDSFLVEAQKRGKKYDIRNLKINFSNDLPESVAGQARLGSYDILINKTNWLKQENYGLENAKEAIIYHEIGHAILGRGHRNEVLPDGSASSIMCGGISGLDTYCSVPYGGMRKAYYIDELFDTSTQIPDWADYRNFKDDNLTNKRQLIIAEEFNNFKNFEASKPANASIKNGVMSFDAGTNGIPSISFQSFSPHFTNSEKNIEIEIKFSVEKGHVSFAWTPTFVGEKGGFLLTINNQLSAQLNLFLNPAIYSTSINKSVDELFIKRDFNVLTLRRIDSKVYFFLNSKLIYFSDIIEGNPAYMTYNNQNFYWAFSLGTLSGICQLDYIRINRITL